MYSTSDNSSTSLTSSSESLMTSSTTICTSCLKMLLNFGRIQCWTSWQSTKNIPFSVQKLFVMLDTCSLQVLIWFSCCCNVINKMSFVTAGFYNIVLEICMYTKHLLYTERTSFMTVTNMSISSSGVCLICMFRK